MLRCTFGSRGPTMSLQRESKIFASGKRLLIFLFTRICLRPIWIMSGQGLLTTVISTNMAMPSSPKIWCNGWWTRLHGKIRRRLLTAVCFDVRTLRFWNGNIYDKENELRLYGRVSTFGSSHPFFSLPFIFLVAL